MTDDEFQAKVLRSLKAIEARQDEQDRAHDVLVSQVDRLRKMVLSRLELNELDLKGFDALSRRVTRLEHPKGGN